MEKFRLKGLMANNWGRLLVLLLAHARAALFQMQCMQSAQDAGVLLATIKGYLLLSFPCSCACTATVQHTLRWGVAGR